MKRNHRCLKFKISLLIAVIVASLPVTARSNSVKSDIVNDFGSSYKTQASPNLSPNEKWLLYHRHDIDWKMIIKNPSLLMDFEGPPTKSYKTFYYLKSGDSKEKEIPLPKLKSGQIFNEIYTKSWSHDGRFLAYSGKIEDKKSADKKFIAIVDFESAKPELVYFVETDDINDFNWSGNELNYSLINQVNYSIYDAKEKISKENNDKKHLNITPPSIIKKRDAVYFANNGKETRTFPDDISPNFKYVLIRIYEKKDIHSWPELAGAQIIDTTSLNTVYELPPFKSFMWSPEGNRLAYSKIIPSVTNDNGRYVHFEPRFYIIDLSNFSEEDYGFGVTEYFSWDPTGRYIYSCGKTEDPTSGLATYGIFIVDTESKSEVGRYDENNICMRPPRISPSQKYVIYDSVGPQKPGFYITVNPFYEKIRSNVNQE